MAVDLGDLIDPLKREVNPLGQNIYTTATDDDYLGYLQDAFWEARLEGITALSGFNEADGSVANSTVGGPDVTRDLLQLVVLFAGIRILRNQLMNLSTHFRAKAGPVEYETDNSAQLLVGILNELKSQRNIILTRLSDVGAIPSYVIDSLVARETSLAYGDTWEASGGYGGVTPGGSFFGYGNSFGPF